MQFTAEQIAQFIGGKIEGDPKVSVHTVSKIQEAQKGSICFLANPRYEEYIATTQASVVLVNNEFSLKAPAHTTLIRVADAYSAFALLLEKVNDFMYAQALKSKTGIEQPSFVSDSAQVGADVYIGAFAYIGKNVKLGDRVKIYPNAYIGDNVEILDDTVIYAGVKIYQNCRIAERCVLHCGVVIGSDGFGFAPQKDGKYKKIPQIGNVIVESDVEIGANTCIDRATMGSTIIKSGVKLDNLIQIAHNVVIDENTVIAAQAGISGSTTIGKNCLIGGQAGIVGHIQLADFTSINAQSGVSKTIKDTKTAWSGSPAFDYKSNLKSNAIFKNLPDLAQKVKELEAQLQALQLTVAEK